MRVIASIVLAILPWLDYLEVWIRIGSGMAAMVVGVFAVRAYISKKKLTDIEGKIKQAEFNERFKQNGHK
jgi:hypothetical protein